MFAGRSLLHFRIYRELAVSVSRLKQFKKNPLPFDRGFSLLNKNTHILLRLAVNYEAINTFKKACHLKIMEDYLSLVSIIQRQQGFQQDHKFRKITQAALFP
jgi:hypothetical protein